LARFAGGPSFALSRVDRLEKEATNMMRPVSEQLPPSKLYVVERDVMVIEFLRRFGRSIGVEVSGHRNGAEFIRAYTPERPSCLVIGIEGPGDPEVALLGSIASRREPIEVIALGTQAAIPLVVRALRAGVLNFLEKPLAERELVDNVAAAIESARRTFISRRQWNDFEKRLAKLTSRQREILHHIVLGKANKVIASELGISERTVEVHRGHLLRRMCVGSAVELARLTGAFQVARTGEAAA